MTPVVLAMVLMSGYKLGKDAATDPLLLAILAAAAVLAAFFSINIVLLFAVAGLLGIAVYGPRGAKGASSDRQLLMVSVPVLFQLGWFFLKTGSLIFGGGYVIIPLIENEVVNKLGWLTHKEFLDGLTLGQMTPGPVVITATFIGYKVAGWAGALLATAAIFAPSFAFIFLGIGTLRRVEHSPRVQAFLKTVTAAAVGAILGALWNLGTVSLFRPVPFVLFAAALTLMLRYKISFSKLLIAGAALGWLAAALFSP
jgi:chromate transporter